MNEIPFNLSNNVSTPVSFIVCNIISGSVVAAITTNVVSSNNTLLNTAIGAVIICAQNKAIEGYTITDHGTFLESVQMNGMKVQNFKFFVAGCEPSDDMGLIKASDYKLTGQPVCWTGQAVLF